MRHVAIQKLEINNIKIKILAFVKKKLDEIKSFEMDKCKSKMGFRYQQN